MSAQNLFGAIALDALGAQVPAGDMAFKIEHEDRVILDTFHKQAKLLTAVPQLFGSSIERNVQLSDLPLHRLLWHFRLLSAREPLQKPAAVIV
jgi:hypothetical protein